jgi:hypothetical protein
MTKGISSLADVATLLARFAELERVIADPARIIEDKDRIIREILEVAVKLGDLNHDLIQRAKITANSDKRQDALFDESVEIGQELLNKLWQNERKYLGTRGKLLAGRKAQDKRTKDLHSDLLKFYRTERPRCNTNKQARQKAHDRLVKKYPEFTKNGRIWSSDKYMADLIRSLRKGQI